MDVKKKEEHESMEAGGSTLPNWDSSIHRNLISAPLLCVPSKSQLAPPQLLYTSVTREFVLRGKVS